MNGGPRCAGVAHTKKIRFVSAISAFLCRRLPPLRRQRPSGRACRPAFGLLFACGTRSPAVLRRLGELGDLAALSFRHPLVRQGIVGFSSSRGRFPGHLTPPWFGSAVGVPRTQPRKTTYGSSRAIDVVRTLPRGERVSGCLRTRLRSFWPRSGRRADRLRLWLRASKNTRGMAPLRCSHLRARDGGCITGGKER